MQLRVGTSGFSYPEWRGAFYPARLAAREMLSFYAQRLASVEINQSFYRMPQPEALARWAAQVPESFRFAIKTPRRITHQKRLRDVHGETAQLLEATRALGARLGPLLVQLPPDFALDAERLAAFLGLLPPRLPVAFEFRHASWAAARVEALLRGHGAALACSDAEDALPELGGAAHCGYLRLRREQYSAAELAAWAQRIRAQPWAEAYVFFKHEREGPARALALREAFERSGAPEPPGAPRPPARKRTPRLSGPRR